MLASVSLPDPQASSPVPSASDRTDADNDQQSAPFQGLQILCCGLSSQLVEEAVRRHDWPVRVVESLDDADVLLSARQGLGREPGLRRQAKEARVPILVIKTDTLGQVERALERLLERRQDETSSSEVVDRSDAFAALEECRLAVEQVVVPHGRPVELLPRTEDVRRMQADLVGRYRLRSDVFGQADQRRLRVFPP